MSMRADLFKAKLTAKPAKEARSGASMKAPNVVFLFSFAGIIGSHSPL